MYLQPFSDQLEQSSYATNTNLLSKVETPKDVGEIILKFCPRRRWLTLNDSRYGPRFSVSGSVAAATGLSNEEILSVLSKAMSMDRATTTLLKLPGIFSSERSLWTGGQHSLRVLAIWVDPLGCGHPPLFPGVIRNDNKTPNHQGKMLPMYDVIK